MFPIHLLGILSLLLCSIHDSCAQTTASGGLTGVVNDPSHAVVPNTAVELRDETKGTIQTAKTDGDGVYQFFFLAPGKYTLSVSHAGFREESHDVNVLLGPPGTRNITLEIAGGSATVKVTDEMPLLQAENGDVSTTMNLTQISQVPNPGNDLTYIAQTAPGAIMNTDTIGLFYLGNFSVLGMPGTSNLFTINGMNDNNIQKNTNNGGALGMMLGQNEVQEATIVSNGYSAQFGGAAAEEIAVPHGGLERGRSPKLKRLGGLDIIVAVEKDGGIARGFERFRIDERVKIGGNDLNRFEAGSAKIIRDPAGGALNIGLVLALGADAGDAQEFAKLREMLVAASFKEFSKIHRGLRGHESFHLGYAVSDTQDLKRMFAAAE